MQNRRIIITDGYALNPGDLDWSPISSVGTIEYYDTTPKELVTARCANADIIITNKTPIDAQSISTSSDLKLIAVTATGYNNVDIEAARKAGVTVCNVPEYGTYSVAQHAFALLLELVNHAGLHAESVKNEEWSASAKWSYSKKPITELKDKKLGIIGFGRIGKQMAVIGKAFGMNIIFCNRSTIDSAIAKQVPMETVFSDSDVVTLHCPLTAENAGFVNMHYLSMMKRGALLINTSRGQLINENDLYGALQDRLLAGAALDVLSEEPPKPHHPLIHHPNCIVTPHIAWLSFEARSRMMQVTVENIRKFYSGDPQNVVGS
jgi:glycerate dehydrogenase